MTTDDRYQLIISALYSRRGLQFLVDTATEALGNPLFVCDSSLKVLASSQIIPEDKEIQLMFYPKIEFTLEAAIEVEKAGIYQHLMNRDEPIYGQFSFYSKRFLGCRIKDKSGTVGFVTVLEHTPITDQDEKLLVFFCKTLLYELLYNERTAMQRIPAFGLIKDILEKRVGQEEIAFRTAAIRWNPSNAMRLLVIDYRNSAADLSIYYLQQSLAYSIPNAQVIVYENQILLLLDDKFYTQQLIQLIKDKTSSLNIICGVSRVLTDLIQLPAAYEQAELAVQIKKRVLDSGFIAEYDKYLVYAFITKASIHCSPEAFYMPAMIQMLEFDSKNSSNLTETARVFLECGKDYKKTIEVLHIHKNTLYYRLQRIEELFHFSFDDANACFELQFSFRLFHYFN